MARESSNPAAAEALTLVVLIGIEEAAQRRDVWALLARLIASEVDLDLLPLLVTEEAHAFWGSKELVLTSGPLSTEQLVEELAVEYCRLFIGPRAECPPYASVYLDEAILGGRARRRVDQFLERHAIELEYPLAVASPDHLAIGFAVLAWIYARRESAPDEVEPLAREFLRDVLLPWAPGFLELLGGRAREPFYRSLARVASRLLKEEGELHGL